MGEPGHYLRQDAGCDAQREPEAVGVHVLGNAAERLALQQRGDAASVVHHLHTAQHVTLRAS